MSRTQMLLQMSLFIGVIMLTAQASVLSEKTEQTNADDSACAKIIMEAEVNFKNCMRPHFTPEDLQEASIRYNGSLCPECFLMCREADNFKNCVKTNFRALHPCYARISHIPQSFFMDLLDSVIDYGCANDSAIMSDLMSPNVKGCEKKAEVCEDRRIGSFFKKRPEGGNDTVPEGVEYTEKGFCSVILHSIECGAIELEDCSETITQTFNSIAEHFKNTASCGRFYNGGDDEGIVEDSEN